MHTRYSLAASAVIGALFSSTASFAEVTPTEVWENWLSSMQSQQAMVTANTTLDGGTLTVSDLTIAGDLEGGKMTVTLGSFTFEDQGDGTVRIIFPESLPVTIRAEDPEGEVVQAVLEYTSDGLNMVASGTPEAVSYSYNATELGLRLAELVVDGEKADNAAASFSIENIVGTSVVTTGDMITTTEKLLATGMRYQISVNDPEGSGFFKADGQTSDINISANMTMPRDHDPNDLSAALRKGMAVDMDFTTGAGAFVFSFDDGEGSTASGSTSSDGNSLTVAMNKDSLRYGAGVRGWEMSMMGSDVPMPINLAVGEMGFDITMPVAKSDMPQDFGLAMRIVDFAPDPMIWSMVDPTSQMPHDPATLIIDVAGTASLLFDILDPAQAEAMMESDMPLRLHELKINQLELRAVGAEISGSGSFTFNNDDLQTFGGMPAPDGKLELKVVGANGLMDKLIAMGLMSEEDAMGFRMMLSLFGRPGEGEDTILSTIEVKENGQVLANGQRLQ